MILAWGIRSINCKKEEKSRISVPEPLIQKLRTLYFLDFLKCFHFSTFLINIWGAEEMLRKLYSQVGCPLTSLTKVIFIIMFLKDIKFGLKASVVILAWGIRIVNSKKQENSRISNPEPLIKKIRALYFLQLLNLKK